VSTAEAAAAARQLDLLHGAWDGQSEAAVFHYRLGPYTLRLVFADAGWAETLTVSFRHLAVAPVARPDFTVRLWDSAGARRPLPRLDWNLIQSRLYRGFSAPPYYLHYFETIAALSAIDASAGVAYYIARDKNALPWWVDASPLQVVLNVFLRERGLQLTHTAAVGDARGAVLLCGKGGSGKSTTALACLRAGLDYIGEDYCLLEPGETPRVYSVYQSAKWEKNTRALYPEYEGFIRNAAAARTEKALVYYEDAFPGRIRTQAPVRALVSLTVGADRRPVLRTQTRERAIKDLLMSTSLQLPFYEARTAATLKEFVGRVPAHHLTLGRDLNANAAAIGELLAASRTPAGAR
jgi:hypothetical protein